MKIVIGTRGSVLARTQTGLVAELLANDGFEINISVISTEGDTNRRSLSQLGGVGVFAAQLRTALLLKQCDLAIHSFKDLPTAEVTELIIAATPKRESVYDVLVARDRLKLSELPSGSKIGTGSPRRKAQLLAIRPDLKVIDIRGNVDTRIGFVRKGVLDAVVLAESGLARLGRTKEITQILTEFLPAPAQGVLAVEARKEVFASSNELGKALKYLDDKETHICAIAERGVLAGLQAGCAAPIGALARIVNGKIELRAKIFSNDGSKEVAVCQTGTDPKELARMVAKDLLDQGGGEITDLGMNTLRRK